MSRAQWDNRSKKTAARFLAVIEKDAQAAPDYPDCCSAARLHESSRIRKFPCWFTNKLRLERHPSLKYTGTAT